MITHLCLCDLCRFSNSEMVIWKRPELENRKRKSVGTIHFSRLIANNKLYYTHHQIYISILSFKLKDIF